MSEVIPNSAGEWIQDIIIFQACALPLNHNPGFEGVLLLRIHPLFPWVESYLPWMDLCKGNVLLHNWWTQPSSPLMSLSSSPPSPRSDETCLGLCNILAFACPALWPMLILEELQTGLRTPESQWHPASPSSHQPLTTSPRALHMFTRGVRATHEGMKWRFHWFRATVSERLRLPSLQRTSSSGLKFIE